MEQQPKFLFYKEKIPVQYPVGLFTENSYCYIKNILEIINELYREKKDSITICFIARGNSGAILSGSLMHFVFRRGYKAYVVLSRKPSEGSHGNNMQGLYSVKTDCIAEKKELVTIVVDDFIATGATLDYIMSDVETYSVSDKLDILFVSNQFTDFSNEILGYRKLLYSRFKYICCNS